MSKLTIFTLAAFVAVAFAQCDWSTVNQEACRQSNTQADCFPDGWPACGGAAYGAGGDGGQAIADILQASCNEVDFLKCFYEYPDVQQYLTCVHPAPCSCAGDEQILKCADAHCTDKSEYPASLTNNIAECRGEKGKHTFDSNWRSGAGGVSIEGGQEDPIELRRRQSGGGLLAGEDVFPIGSSCTEPSLSSCLNELAVKYESCVDPFNPCLCSALSDIQECYTASCTSPEDQPTIVTNNIIYCPGNTAGVPPPADPTPTPVIPSTSIDVVNPSTTSTPSLTTLLTAYIAPPGPPPQPSPPPPPSPPSPPSPPLPPLATLRAVPPSTTISTTSVISTATSTSSATAYIPIEPTSTASTTVAVVVTAAASADPNQVSTSTTIVPSTTVTAETTTTSTVESTGAAATMNVEVGMAGMAAAAMGFAALF